MSSWILKTIVFLSAFLLFQIELIIGKIFLPRYGGSFMVWGACMVFFQAVLLLGYMYAHLVIQRVGLHRYRYGHLILLAVPLFFFPGRPLFFPSTEHQLPMVLDVFIELTCILGPVFFVLSTMSIIYQAWVAESDLPEKSNPYALFAVSNLGSFAALLTYPFIFEMHLDLQIQQNIWRLGYLMVVLLQLAAIGLVPISKKSERASKAGGLTVGRSQCVRWILFGCAGVMMFLSVTNIITLGITPMPLLWVLPLALYLLSYVLNFKKIPFCPSWIREKFDLVVAYGVFLYFLLLARGLPILWELILVLGFLFVVCMYCQRELYLDRPTDSRQLSFYYFMTALGGFLGGIVVTWIIPHLSSSLVEFFLGPLVIYLARILREKKRGIGPFYSRFIFYWVAVLILYPTVFPKISLMGIFLMLALLKLIFDRLKENITGLTAGLTIIILMLAVTEQSWTHEPTIYKRRNYYGILKVVEDGRFRMLIHGKTVHGTQYFDLEENILPLLYYQPDTPVGRIMKSDHFDLRSVGVVGLGVGAMAMYDGGDDAEMDFYELDPDVLFVADKYFEFLKRSPRKINHFIGDGRIFLAKSPDKKYDLLIIDVFTGDSVPTHFLTKEAMELYKSKIKDNGLVMFHLSNQIFDPVRVLSATAQAAGAKGCLLDGRKEYGDAFSSKWFAMTWDGRAFDVLVSQMGWHELDATSYEPVRIWTDQFSNVLPYIDFFKGIPSVERK